jgi:serine/threonine-protein kinase
MSTAGYPADTLSALVISLSAGRFGFHGLGAFAGVVAIIVTTGPQLLLDDRYRLDDRIGAGGMGEVWRATDVVLRRPVAVKLLRPGLAQHEDDLARFRAEARSAASVPHPCVVQVYDYCEDDPCGRPYLVMELVDGTSLDRLLASGPLGAAFTMDVIAQAAQGLAVAHRAGLVHRDVKPQNLLLTRSGQVKITDFGIARAAGSAPVTRAGTLLGSPAYLAPERALGQAATPAADMYALGIVAYQCLAGRLPFTGEPLAVMLAHKQQPLPPLPPSVPSPVAALVAHLTAKEPGARPASAGQVGGRARQLHAALSTMAMPRSAPAAGQAGTAEPLLGVLAGMMRPRNSGSPGRRQHRRHPLALAGRVGLAAASVGAIGLTGWIVAHASTAQAMHQPLSRPGAVTEQPSIHPSAQAPPRHHRRLVAARRDRATDPPAIAAPYQGPASPAGPATPSRTPSRTFTTPTPSGTPTASPTPSGTPTSSPTPSGTPTSSPTPSGTPTRSPTPSGTPTISPGVSPAAGTALTTTPSTPVAASSVPSG